uniref:histidine kinase n=1 Tax=Rubinisphaera brasiliensis (strain ATCC 49424 / DSM 5305 / JCM 21570 / IAM 15109 / NBRC 103401 / IFAM 1448) TaxID=756272 RepID=F0SIA5_RUBBR|nr:PAS/PAC sensor hybrid histidine kinase [Rubinisphaera brasiliensis DSM 5305]
MESLSTMPAICVLFQTLGHRLAGFRKQLPPCAVCRVIVGSLLACVIGLVLIDQSFHREIDLTKRELRSRHLAVSQDLLSLRIVQELNRSPVDREMIGENLATLNQQHDQLVDDLIRRNRGLPVQFRPIVDHVLALTPLLSEFTAEIRTALASDGQDNASVAAASVIQRQYGSALQELSQALNSRSETFAAAHPRWGWLFNSRTLLGLSCFLAPVILGYRLQRQFQAQADQLTARGDEILATKRHLLSAIGATAGGLWSWTLETDELWTNHEFWILLGYRQNGEFPHNQIASFRDHVHPKDRQLLDNAIETHLRMRLPLDVEIRFWHLQDECRWMRLRAQTERNANDVPVRLAGVVEDIHAHKLAELKLNGREQEVQRLALVARQTTNGVVITNSSGQVEWVNEGFSRLTGYTLDDLLGRKPGSVLQGPHSDVGTISDMRRAIAAGQSFKAELVNYHKSGREYWVRIEGDPIHDEQGQLTGFIAIQSDISERVQFAQELAASREQFKNMLEHLPVAAYTCDANGLITFYNKAAVKLWGRTPALNNPADRYCGSFRLFERNGTPLPAEKHLMARALSQPGQNQSSEIIVEAPDGSRKTGMAYAKALVNAEQEVTGGVNVIVDMTERIALEQSLREATARLELCLKILDEHAIVAETDLKGIIRDVNDMFCDVSGYSREELIGNSHRILNSGFHPRTMWTEVFRQIARTGMWQGEICNRRKNGELYWVDTTIAAIHDAAGRPNGYFAIRNDITELKAAKEAALAASHSKSEFLANMSHEIRTPLTAIIGYAEILRDDPEIAESPEKRSHALNTIHEAGRHLLTIISDILDLSKIEAGKMSIEQTDTSVANVLSQVESFLRPRAVGKGLSLTTRLAQAIPDRIQSDPTRLRQILMNLVGNAIKFTEAGHIQLTVSRIQREDKEFLQFDIEDTGTGMTDTQREQIFQAFSQADTSVTRQYGGTGLGLVICRRLARLMNGDVWLLWSEAGRGTCFRAALPCVPSCNAVEIDNLVALDAPDPACTRPDQASFPYRILLAEDGPDNQRLISFLLRKLGATVEIAENGAVALDRFHAAAESGSPFELLVTDIQMPEMDGYTLTRTLRSEGSTIPILALTAHAMAEDRQKCLAAGCNEFLTKPVKKSDLINALEQIITGRPTSIDQPQLTKGATSYHI